VKPEDFKARFDTLTDAMARAVVGHHDTIVDLLTGVFAGGSILLEAPPGLGKTLIGKTLAAALSMKATRIQFTPDLMPADIVGTNVVVEDERGSKEMVFQRGPVFANVLLADEINRATPKTQSALLEAMQEHHVTVAGTTYPLDEPFLVVATQNPEDLEGTYRLPEAQIDRFLFRLRLAALADPEWIEVVRRRTGAAEQSVRPALSKDDVLAMQAAARQVGISREVCAYGARIVAATHPDGNGAIEPVRKFLRLGASPRGLQAMVLGAKVRALCDGRTDVAASDIRSLAIPALSHRLLLNFEGQAERIRPQTIIEAILNAEQSGICNV
jgi:MoxR-like ATPase